MSGVRLTDLRNDSRPLSIDLWGRKVGFSYKPMALTYDEENEFVNRWQSEAKKLEDIKAGVAPKEEVGPDGEKTNNQAPEDSTFEYLMRLLGSWELLSDEEDERGQPFKDSYGEIKTYPTPITIEWMHKIPSVITLSIFVEIGKDRSPNLTTGPTSGAPSSTQKEDEGSLTG